MLLLLIINFGLWLFTLHSPYQDYFISNYSVNFHYIAGRYSSLYILYLAVPCPSLTDPNNGVMTCSLGDDGVPYYEDTCSFTCNTGYELTGSDTRTCQSDGSWSGTETVCGRGLLKLAHYNNY